MSRTIEVPRENWADYLCNLSKRALAQPVRVELLDSELGDQELSNLQPLLGIDFDTRGSEAGSIDITLGKGTSELEHRIDGARGLFLLVSDEGNLECLEIEGPSGSKTLVRFERLAALPAWVPGAGEQPAP